MACCLLCLTLLATDLLIGPGLALHAAYAICEIQPCILTFLEPGSASPGMCNAPSGKTWGDAEGPNADGMRFCDAVADWWPEVCPISDTHANIFLFFFH